MADFIYITATGDLRRWGFSTMTAGTGESRRTDGPVPGAVRTFGAPGQFDRWNGSAWVKVNQPAPLPTILMVDKIIDSAVALTNTESFDTLGAVVMDAEETSGIDLQDLYIKARFMAKANGTGAELKIVRDDGEATDLNVDPWPIPDNSDVWTIYNFSTDVTIATGAACFMLQGKLGIATSADVRFASLGFLL